MITPQKITKLDETYLKLAFRVLTEPRDMDWHQLASQLMDEAPNYGYEKGPDGENINPKDVFEIAGRILGYGAGMVRWTPEENI